MRVTSEPDVRVPARPIDRMAHAYRSRGLRHMAAAAFYFSVMSLFVKLAGRRLPSQEVVLARSVFMMAVSLAVIRSKGGTPWGNRRGLLWLRGILGYGALSCFYFAIIHLPLAEATVIQYTNPVFAALLAAGVLAEPLEWRHGGLLALSLAGVLLMTRPAFLPGAGVARLDLLVVAVALAGAAFSGAAYVTVRKLGNEEPFVIILYFAVVSTLGSLPLVASAPVLPSPSEWALLLGVGITTQLGQIHLTTGLHLERAGPATAVGYVQIVFAALWEALFIGTRPDAWTLAGAALIIASTLRLRPAK